MLSERMSLFVEFIFRSHVSMLYTMVLILDGISEISVHVKSKIGNLICVRHLLRSAAVAYLKFIFHTCATCSGLPCNISTKVYTVLYVFYRG